MLDSSPLKVAKCYTKGDLFSHTLGSLEDGMLQPQLRSAQPRQRFFLSLCSAVLTLSFRVKLLCGRVEIDVN